MGYFQLCKVSSNVYSLHCITTQFSQDSSVEEEMKKLLKCTLQKFISEDLLRFKNEFYNTTVTELKDGLL